MTTSGGEQIYYGLVTVHLSIIYDQERNSIMTLEQLQEQIVTMQEQMEELKLINETLATEKVSQQTKIDELSSINQKLFLRVTTPVKGIEEDNTNKEYEEHVGKEFWNKLSNVDQTKLINILEGEDE